MLNELRNDREGPSQHVVDVGQCFLEPRRETVLKTLTRRHEVTLEVEPPDTIQAVLDLYRQRQVQTLALVAVAFIMRFCRVSKNLTQATEAAVAVFKIPQSTFTLLVQWVVKPLDPVLDEGSEAGLLALVLVGRHLLVSPVS